MFFFLLKYKEIFRFGSRKFHFPKYQKHVSSEFFLFLSFFFLSLKVFSWNRRRFLGFSGFLFSKIQRFMLGFSFPRIWESLFSWNIRIFFCVSFFCFVVLFCFVLFYLLNYFVFFFRWGGEDIRNSLLLELEISISRKYKGFFLDWFFSFLLGLKSALDSSIIHH